MNAVNENGLTPLHLLVSSFRGDGGMEGHDRDRHFSFVSYLLSRGMDPAAAVLDHPLGLSPFHLAVARNLTAVARAFLAYRKDLAEIR